MCSYFTFKGKLSFKNHSIETPGMIFSSHFFRAADDKKNPDSDNVGFSLLTKPLTALTMSS